MLTTSATIDCNEIKLVHAIFIRKGKNDWTFRVMFGDGTNSVAFEHLMLTDAIALAMIEYECVDLQLRLYDGEMYWTLGNETAVALLVNLRDCTDRLSALEAQLNPFTGRRVHHGP